MSTTSTGNYYRLKTKKILEKMGFECEYLEQYFQIGPGRFMKRDLFSSDILAVGPKGVWFVQVKCGYKHIAEARKNFARHSFPRTKLVKPVIYMWIKREKKPYILPV